MEQAKLPPELRLYIREVEAKSGLTVHPKQRELLAEDLRQNAYTKLDKAVYTEHTNQFTKSTKDKLIIEWEKMGGEVKVREWPKHPKSMKTKNGKPHPQAGKDFQLHHINPQELGGKHVWWNSHPVHIQDHIHKGGIHSGIINDIVEGVINNG